MSSGFKYQKENIGLRRDKVLELCAQGFNQGDISKKLGCSISLISRDLKYIRAQALNTVRGYINEKLPEEYNHCLTGLNAILKESWTVSQSSKDNREKLQALSLAKDCYSQKLDLLTNVKVLEDVIQFVNKQQTQSQTEQEEQTEEEELTKEDSEE
jgi:hypothetical protein